MPPRQLVLPLPEPADRRRLTGHRWGAYACAISSDGQRLATASGDCTIRLASAISGEPIAVLRGHTSRVYCCRFSPGGTRLFSVARDGSIRSWCALSGEPLLDLAARPGRGAVWLALSPDGRVLAAPGRRGKLMLWSAQSGQLIAKLDGYPGGTLHVGFSADGTLLAVAGPGARLDLWDGHGRTWQRSVQSHAGGFTAFDLSLDSRWLATSSHAGIEVWDLLDGRCVGRLVEQPFHHAVPVFLPDSRLAVLGYPQNAISLWNFRENTCTPRRFHGAPFIIQVAITPDRATLAFSTVRSLRPRAPWQVVLFRPGEPQPLSYVIVPGASVRGITLSSCGSRLVTASSDGGAVSWG